MAFFRHVRSRPAFKIRMDRAYIIRGWLRRELEAQERSQGPASEETEYEALLRELLAVIDRHTFKMK